MSKPTIKAIYLGYEKDTSEFTLTVTTREDDAPREYVVAQEDAVAFHTALQSALALAREV